MTTEQVEKYIENNLSPQEDKTPDNFVSSETSTASGTEDNSIKPAPVENDKAETSTTEVKTNEQPPKKELSHQEKINFKFAKEKQKRKALEERIKQLESEREKYKNLSKSDFGDNEDQYLDYKLDQRLSNIEQKQLQKQIDELDSAEFTEINEKRIQMCFPNEQDRKQYEQMLNVNGRDFVAYLDSVDADGVILNYLDDCDYAPLVIRMLMANENIRKSVCEKRNGFAKIQALQDLTNKIRYAQARLAQRSKKPKLQDTGRVVQTLPDVEVRKDGKYFNDLLSNLNKRKYR